MYWEPFYMSTSCCKLSLMIDNEKTALADQERIPVTFILHELNSQDCQLYGQRQLKLFRTRFY